MCLVGSVSGSGVDLRVGISSRSFIGNNLLLKLSGTFFLALNNNPNWFKENFFSLVFLPLSKFFIFAENLVAHHQHLLMTNILHVYPLKTQYAKNIHENNNFIYFDLYRRLSVLILSFKLRISINLSQIR